MEGSQRPDMHDLYERYGRAVYRRCQYFLRNDADAKDAMHDVFLKVASGYASFKGEASSLTWIVRITTNHCLNVLRSRRAGWHSRFEMATKVDADARLQDVSASERAELVRSLLGKVDRPTQEAAIYYFVDEMTQEEAAAAAGCSVPTLRKRLRTFIRIARRELHRIDATLVFGEEPV